MNRVHAYVGRLVLWAARTTMTMDRERARGATSDGERGDSIRTPIKRRSEVSSVASGSKSRKRRLVRDAAPAQSSPGGLATGGRPACEPACGLATGGRPAYGHASSEREREKCKAELSRRRTEAELELQPLRAQALFPVTRLQWAEWLEENLN